jgi:hypothetical protein
MVQVIPRTPSASESLANLLGGGAQGLSQGYAQGMQGKLQQMMDTRKSAAERQRLEGVFEQLGLPKAYAGLPEGISKELLKEKTQENKLQQLMQLLGGGQGGEEAEDTNIERQGPQGISDENILAISAIDPNMARLLQAQKESGYKREATAFKETRDTRQNILKGAKAAQETNMRLDRMETLIEEGNLIPGLFNSFLQKAGLDLPALKNPDSQEFEKLSTDMTKNARESYGSRLTNFDLETFLKTIPTLSQTTEGQKRVIHNLRLLNEGARLRSNAMNKIVKSNKGIPPFDLAERIDEKIAPKLDKLAKDFKKGLSPTGSSASAQETIKMRDPAGNLRAVPKDQAKKAQEAGYRKA